MFNKEVNKFPNDIFLINDYLEKLVSIKLPYKECDLGSSGFFENEGYFNKQVIDVWDENEINKEKESHYIFDNLRHSFYSYKFGG